MKHQSLIFSASLGLAGATNKREWDSFSRACQDRKKFPVALAEHLQKDKTDLFNLWLTNGKDLNKLFCCTQCLKGSYSGGWCKDFQAAVSHDISNPWSF